jgi:putative drug exporter of the RND superfamily
VASVFLSFLLSTNVVVKMLALGLGVSVLIDATVIRLIVVPATMFLLGRYNWWIPRWLDRALPHLNPRARPPGPNPDPITPRDAGPPVRIGGQLNPV